MKYETATIASLMLDPANVRTHDSKNLESIKASLARFGQQTPIVVNSKGIVVAGNARLMAAKMLNWSSVEIVRTDLEGAEAIAYAIADNRTAELAGWDEAALAQQLAALQIDDEELANIAGFTDAEIEAMILDGKEIEEDEVPEPPVDPITKTGDLWLLGTHRVLCGDSTKAEDVARLMMEQKAELWLTDPPYNVDYVGKTKDALKVENDSMSNDDFKKFLVACFIVAFKNMKPGASFYVFHADTEGYNFRGAIYECEEKVRQCLIWVKNCLIMGRQNYQWQHEPCLYGWKKGAAHSWFSGRTDTTVFDDSRPKDLSMLKKKDLLAFAQSLVSQMEKQETTVLREAKPNASIDHPTMKPVRLIARLIKNSTLPKWLIYDSFLGSGTTIIAAEQLNRKCYGMEISPAYCDVIVKRWETLTGKTATLST